MRSAGVLISALAVAAAITVRARAPDATASGPAMPNTPAGAALKAWLRACNSGNRTQIEGFYRACQPRLPMDGFLNFCHSTGGFDLISITRSEPRHIEYLATDRAHHNRAAGELDVTDTDPPRLIKGPVYLIAPNARLIGYLIDSAVRARVVTGVATKLDQLYVEPDLGKRMALDITRRWRRGEYDSIKEGDEFAQQLTKDLRTISHDGHLRVNFSAAEFPADGPEDSAASVERQWAQLEGDNCGFRRVEWLPGNIGYIRFDEFGNSAVCAPTADAAMAFLANVDAIIFDLRENHGGDPQLVTLLESYLFASPAHLDDFFDRPSGQTRHTWTLPIVPGKRLPSVPVYILTSHGTFSGGEAFAYELQALKRATVVGEVTGGGGHLVGPVRVDPRFMLNLPSAEPINPITKTNWEGKGVVPDVKVPAAQALDVAEKLAATELAKKQSNQQTANK